LPADAQRSPEGDRDGDAIEAGVAEWCRRNPGRRLVVVIDQLEELITLARDADVKERFVALLEHLLASASGQFRVIVTLRTDFEPPLADLALQARWADARYVLRPMALGGCALRAASHDAGRAAPGHRGAGIATGSVLRAFVAGR
jgi:hypothetical protein